MTVASFTSTDVSYISARQVKMVVLLARAFGWNVYHKIGQPTTLMARDGHKLIVPNNQTSIRDSVLKGWINQIITHTENPRLSQHTASQIAAMAKAKPEHLRMMLQHVNEKDEKWTTISTNSLDDRREDTPEPEPVAEIKPGVVIPAARPHVVSRERRQVAWGVRSYPSEYVDVRTWSDGAEDYECVLCGYSSGSMMTMGSHKRAHPEVRGESEDRLERIRAANPTMRQYRKRRPEIPPVPATPVAEIEDEPSTEPPVPDTEDETPTGPTILNVDQVADAIRGLVSEATIDLQKQVATITADRDTWKARAEKAEGDLDALRDLLGGKR